jgi:outer membrane lipoprotein-sorting protein
MKKTLTVCALGFFLLSLIILPASNLNAQEKEVKKSDPKALKILDESIEAMGGRKLLETIKDTTITGSMELITMGMEGSLTIYSKEPDKMRIDIEIMGMTITQAYDGEMAWMINPQTGANEEMPEQMTDDFKRDAMGNEIMLYPEKHNIVYTYKGIEKLEDKDHHVLTQIHPDGWEATMYIDTETNLTYKVVAMTTNQMGVDVETETFTTDYTKIDGMMVAHTMTTYQDGEEFMTMTLTEIKLNSGLEDSLFKME